MAEPEIARHTCCCQEVSEKYRWPGQLMKNRLSKNERCTDKAKFENHKKQQEKANIGILSSQ
jgi:hypothetical protein